MINKHKQTDIFFYLFSESNIPNIESLSIKLFEKKKKKEIPNSISYLDFEKTEMITYRYKVNSSSLSKGDYYIEFNGTSFSDYELVIAEGKNMINVIGDIYTNYDKNQYFIIEFKEILEENDIANILLLDEDKNYTSKCELMLDNNKSLLCKVNENISKEGTYKLGYIDECGKLVRSEKTINVIQYDSEPIPLNQIKKYDISNENEECEITLSNQMTNNKKIVNITLIRTDSLKNEINVNYTPSLNNNKLKFKILNDTELGDYIMKFKFENNTVVITPLIILFDGNFDL